MHASGAAAISTARSRPSSHAASHILSAAPDSAEMYGEFAVLGPVEHDFDLRLGVATQHHLLQRADQAAVDPARKPEHFEMHGRRAELLGDDSMSGIGDLPHGRHAQQ